MKLPVTVNCSVIESDTLTVQAVCSDGDIEIYAKDEIANRTVSIYLTPDSARRLRKALKEVEK